MFFIFNLYNPINTLVGYYTNCMDAQHAARWTDPAPERVISGPRSRL